MFLNLLQGRGGDSPIYQHKDTKGAKEHKDLWQS